MFKESDLQHLNNGRGPEKMIETVHVVNGLLDDTINQWGWRSAIITQIKKDSNVEENTGFLRDPVVPYDEYIQQQYTREVADPVSTVHENQESSEEAIARYDELAKEYNQLIEAPEIDLDALARVVKAACMLYGRETPDI